MVLALVSIGENGLPQQRHTCAKPPPSGCPIPPCEARVFTGPMFLFIYGLAWSLWAIPAAALVFLVVNRSFTHRFLQSFAHEELPPEIAVFRRTLTLLVAFLARFAFAVCLVSWFQRTHMVDIARPQANLRRYTLCE